VKWIFVAKTKPACNFYRGYQEGGETDEHGVTVSVSVKDVERNISTAMMYKYSNNIYVWLEKETGNLGS